ncbi:MAG: DNA repair protein RecO C-terminal domain-containing protein, partial [Eggerthellaceae bacterium]
VLPHVNEHVLLGITAAHLIKTVSFLGFKPELSCCIVCGDTDVVTHALSFKHKVAFSSLEGGIVCSKCVPFVETVWVEPQVIQWAQVLLYSTFEEIQGFELDSSTQLGLLRFLQTWIKEHIGFTLKSLTYVFSYGLA